MRRSAALLAALAGAAAPAVAATDTAQFQVTATVVASCDVSAQDLSFGAYDPVAAGPHDAATTLSIFCTNGADYEIGLDAGIGAGATHAARRMTSGGDQLVYSLYRDAARTQVWGENLGADTLGGTGAGAAQSINVYARAPAQQTAPAGAYADTITVTVTY